MKSYIAN